MVEKHIKSLLYDHDCVIIPDFGGLIARYVPARINPVKHTLQPPSKKIAFNEKLVLNDGLLISTIAHYNGISKEEAQRVVAQFVHHAKTSLHHDNRFELEEIGVFRYNSERRLVFEYMESENLLEASFGLPELVARPVRVEEPAVLRTLIKERQQELVESRQPLRRRIRRAYNVAAGLALAGLSVGALYFLSLQAEYNLSSLNPVMLLNAGSSTVPVQANRYADDYVPYTNDERTAAYATMLPAATNTVLAETVAAAGIAEEEMPAISDTLAFAPEGATDEPFIAEEKPAVQPEETKFPAHIINRKDGRFYIITGGYARLENAEVSRAEVAGKGASAKIVLPAPGSRLYRVTVADFATPEEAHAALHTYRQKFGETLWVLNN